MKQKIVLFVVCLVMLVNLIASPIAHASPLDQLGIPGLSKATLTEEQQALFDHLETQVIPQIEAILTPTQSEQFKAAIAEGTSFRKAFKALTLTPEQKTELATLLKSMPKRDILASLTPEQKRSFFLKKKELFMPTSEEVTERIEASLQEKGVELPPEVRAKIDAGLKKREMYAPSAEAIAGESEAATSTSEEPSED